MHFPHYLVRVHLVHFYIRKVHLICFFFYFGVFSCFHVTNIEDRKSLKTVRFPNWIIIEENRFAMFPNISSKKELTNLPFCFFLTSLVWNSWHFLALNVVLQMFQLNQKPAFGNCFFDLTSIKDCKFCKTIFVILVRYKISQFLSFPFLFYYFLSVLEWFRFNLQKTFFTYNVVLYLLWLLVL